MLYDTFIFKSNSLSLPRQIEQNPTSKNNHILYDTYRRQWFNQNSLEIYR